MAYYVQLFVCSCSLKLLGWRSFLWQSRFALLVTALRSVKAANEGEKTETVVKKSKKQLAKEAEAAKAAAEAAEGAEE